MSKDSRQKLITILIAAVFSVIAVKGISVSLPTPQSAGFHRAPYGIAVWMVLTVILCAGFAGLWMREGIEQKKTALRVSLFCLVCALPGYYFQQWGTICSVWQSRNDLINFVCHWFGFFFIAFTLCLGMIRILEKLPIRKERSSVRGLFFIVFFLLLLAWSPWFMDQFPGVLTVDSDNQLKQAMGNIPLWDNHPILHTLWIRLLCKIGGSAQNGVALYSITQTLLMAAVFAGCTCFIDRKFCRTGVTLATLAFFGLYPVHPLYAVTMWKDIPFALCLLLIEMELFNFSRGSCRTGKIGGLFLCLCLLRHNGILVFIPTMIYMLIRYPAMRRKLLICSLVVSGIVLCFQYILIPALGLKSGRSSEGFSIPLQQIARVASRHSDEISEEQEEILKTYFSGRNIAERYRGTLSNPVKNVFSEDAFHEDPKPILQFWFDWGKAYPKEYAESILNNSYGFWYPGAIYPSLFFGQDVSDLLGIHPSPLAEIPIIRTLRTFFESLEYFKIPLLGWLLTPGLASWILFFSLQYSKLKKRSTLVLVPLLALWVQMFGSPAFCEYRYVYGLIISLPMILSSSLLPDHLDE